MRNAQVVHHSCCGSVADTRAKLVLIILIFSASEVIPRREHGHGSREGDRQTGRQIGHWSTGPEERRNKSILDSSEAAETLPACLPACLNGWSSTAF